MKNYPFLFGLIFFTMMSINCQVQRIQCEIKTEKGSILVELYPEKAPNTVTNFLKYVDAGLYKDAAFFRVCTPKNEAKRDIKIEVIQGGIMNDSIDFPPIKLETTTQTSIKHLDGIISMARSEPDSATNSFFICIGDQPELDYKGKRNPDGQGFAAFGKVIRGMRIVKLIQQEEDKSQYLINPVKILSISRI